MRELEVRYPGKTNFQVTGFEVVLSKSRLSD